MQVRTFQRSIALSFLVGTIAIGILFVRIFRLAGIQLEWSPWSIVGVVGWGILICGSLIIILHPRPEATHLGRRILRREPLFEKESTEGARGFVVAIVAALALLGVFVSVFFFTDTAQHLFETYGW